MVGPDAVLVLGRSAFHDVVSATQYASYAVQTCQKQSVSQAHSFQGLTTQFQLLSVLQSLTSSGDLSYLGAQWRRDVAFAGYGIPLQVMSMAAPADCFINCEL